MTARCSYKATQIDSAFPLTEHLRALHHHHTHPDAHTTTPVTAELALQLAHPPPNTAKEIWLYELARFLIQKTNIVIVALFADSPACSAQTCPEMRASEWQYLCAVHDPPKSCTAIDYCCHTLDWAATSLCNSKLFPSRLGLGSGQGGHGADKILQQQLKEITNIFRRVYRIYAHAWFQHREAFWRVEGKTGLYVFFKTVCDEYGMIQAENYTIPPEAEGVEPPPSASKADQSQQGITPTLLRRPESAEEHQPEPAGNQTLATGDTTKRHRHTLSDRGSSISTTITEEAEEEEEAPPRLSLERAPTALKAEDAPEAEEAKPGESESAAKAEPSMSEQRAGAPGSLQRSDTVKPPKAGQDKEDEDEADDPAEVTVIEVPESDEVEGKEEAKPEKEAETVVDAAAEKANEPAAEGEEAAKTVED